MNAPAQIADSATTPVFDAPARARFSPAAPGRWPQQNYARAYAFRVLRKLGLTGA